jgi:flagellar biosynthesis GTPase FlhF
MNATEILSKVKTLLGVDASNLEVKAEAVSLEELTLENGTVITAGSFEAGNEVFIKTEDEKVPMPVGEYELGDNRTLIVKTEGMIEEIKNSEEVVEETQEETQVEQNLEEEKSEMGYATKEEMTALAEAVEEVKNQLREVIEKMMDKKEEKEEMAKQEELSKPAAEGIKHSPEAEETKLGAKYAVNSNQNTTYNRVLQAITNN